MASTRYVKKAEDGGWDVVKEGHRQATAHGATKDDAVQLARRLILQEGGGEIRVMNRTGKVVKARRSLAAAPAPRLRTGSR